MSTREELHALVECLGDDQATGTLVYLQRLLRDAASEEAAARRDERAGPLLVSGRSFFSQPQMDLEALAAQQGVKPVADFEDLLGDFWPEDETADEFIAAVRRWRRQGKNG